jgi:hypothetical protein
MVDRCERCCARVAQAGDHVCLACADLLGRPATEPFWGDFRNQADALLRGEVKRAGDFLGALDGIGRRGVG